MCTTIQYFFCCGHAATHRFRNQLCQQAKGRICRIRDISKFLETECRRCAHERIQRAQRSRVRDPAFQDVWYIPTRCFVDVGFRTLDPFHAEAEPEPISPLTMAPPLSPLATCVPKTASLWEQVSSPRSEKSPIDKFFPRFRRQKKQSPCCDEKSLADAFLVVQLEDYGARIEGRIVDNHCESLQ